MVVGVCAVVKNVYADEELGVKVFTVLTLVWC